MLLIIRMIIWIKLNISETNLVLSICFILDKIPYCCRFQLLIVKDFTLKTKQRSWPLHMTQVNTCRVRWTFIHELHILFWLNDLYKFLHFDDNVSVECWIGIDRIPVMFTLTAGSCIDLLVYNIIAVDNINICDYMAHK